MLEKSFGLLFYLKKPKNYCEGNMPVYLRITVDGVPKEMSTHQTCDPERWSPEAQRVKGTKIEHKSLNVYLDTLERKVYEALTDLIESGKVITAAYSDLAAYKKRLEKYIRKTSITLPYKSCAPINQ